MSATDTYSNLVQQFYVAYFGRPADPAAVPSFAAALAAANAPTTLAALTSAYGTSDTIRALVDNFGNSHESAALYGTVTSDVGQAINFVTAIFTNLFNRAPVQAGVDFWVQALLNGSLSPGNAALTIAAAAAANTTGQGALDAQAVTNKVAVATQFTADLSDPAYVAAYAGADAAAAARALLAGVGSSTDTGAYAATIQQTADTIANVQPTAPSVPSGPSAPVTFALTSGNDVQTASTFNGVLSSVASTLNAGDVLTGTGAAVLNLTSDGTTLPTGATLSHIQTINIAATADQSVANVSGYAGVTALNITVASGAAGHTSTITAAATQAVNVTGDVLSGSTSASYLDIHGGASATVTAVGTAVLGSINVGSISVDGVAGAINLTENYTANAANSYFDGMYVTGGSAVTLNSTINVSALDNISFEGTLQVLNATGAVTINDAVNVTSTSAVTDYAQYVSVYHAGSTVTVNETVTTASGATAISTVREGNVDITGGATTTSVTVNQAAPVAGAVGGSAHVIDGSVSITDSQGSSAAANTITNITLSNYSSAGIIDQALTTLTLSGTDGAMTITNNASSPNSTLTLNLNSANVGVITDTHQEIATLNLHVTGSSSLAGFSVGYADVDVSGTGALAITLSGNETFNGSSAIGAGAEVVTVTGDVEGYFTGGSSAHNELVLSGASSNFDSDTGDDIENFSILGVNDSGAIVIDSYDMNDFGSGFTTIDVIANVTSDSFTNVTAGTALQIDNGGNFINYSLATASNVLTSVDVTLGTAASTGIAVTGALTLADHASGGIPTVNLVSNGSGTNTMASLDDIALANLNVSGTASVSITSLAAGTPGHASPNGQLAFALSNNGSGLATIATLTDDTLAHLTVSGSGATAIGTLEVDDAPALTITNNSGHALAIGTLSTDNNAMSGDTGGLASITFDGSGDVNITTLTDFGNTATSVALHHTGTGVDSIAGWFADAAVTELTVDNNIALGGATVMDPAILLTADSGVTVNAGGDNARLNLVLIGAGSGATDTIAVGNGANQIADHSNDGTVNVSVGSGANMIDLSNTASASYQATVTLAAHASAHDTITVGYAAAGAVVPNVVINGIAAGDQLIFDDAATTINHALSTGDQTTVGALATLDDAVHYVDAMATAHSATAFQYGGNTYVLESAETGTGVLTSYDSLVELAGTSSLTGITVGFIAGEDIALSLGQTSYFGGLSSDTFTANYSDGDAASNFSASDAIDGGAGLNTLVINPVGVNETTTLTDSNFGTIGHIQNLQLGSTGAGALSLTTGSNFAADFATLNLTATTDTGALTLDLGAYDGAATISATTGFTIVNITTGAGIDSVTVTTMGLASITSNSTTGATLSGTATLGGSVNLNASAAATAGVYTLSGTAAGGTVNVHAEGGSSNGNEVYNITLGAHAAANIYVSAIGASTGANTVITNAAAGDTLFITDGAAGSADSALGPFSSLADGLAAAHGAASAGVVETFTFNNDTYLVEDVGTGAAATSTVIQLVGSHTIGAVVSGQIVLSA